MFRAKKGPYILLALLILILVFILGLQYGKYIQKLDTTFQYILSLTPTQQPKPTITPDLRYEYFSNTGCGISFLYPSSLRLEHESSSEAEIILSDGKKGIYMLCDDSKLTTPKGASSEAILDNKNGIVYTVENTDYVEFRIRNAKNETVSLELLKELEPLIVTSFSFID